MASAKKSGLRKDNDTIEFDTSEDVEVTQDFESLQLKEDLIRGIYAYGLFSFSFLWVG